MNCINCSSNICIDYEYVMCVKCQAVYCLNCEEYDVGDLFYVDEETTLCKKKCPNC